MCPADFVIHTHFLHLSQLYMLSPGKRNNADLNSGKILLHTSITAEEELNFSFHL